MFEHSQDIEGINTYYRVMSHAHTGSSLKSTFQPNIKPQQPTQSCAFVVLTSCSVFQCQLLCFKSSHKWTGVFQHIKVCEHLSGWFLLHNCMSCSHIDNKYSLDKKQILFIGKMNCFWIFSFYVHCAWRFRGNCEHTSVAGGRDRFWGIGVTSQWKLQVTWMAPNVGTPQNRFCEDWNWWWG